MSEDAYFEMLEKSVDKYEYRNGFAVARAGGLLEHSMIEINLAGELFQQLRGKSCRPFGVNQAVKLAGSRGYVFPDLSIVCGKAEYVLKRGIGCLINPRVVFEVLSLNTANVNESDKVFAYTAVVAVREYLEVSSWSYLVKHFSRRSADETWRLQVYGDLTDRVELESCSCSLTLAEIYAGVEFAA